MYLIFQIESPELFWFQPKCEQYQIEQFSNELIPRISNRIVCPILSIDDIQLHQIVAVKFNNKMYRGKVVSKKMTRNQDQSKIQVRLTFNWYF